MSLICGEIVALAYIHCKAMDAQTFVVEDGKREISSETMQKKWCERAVYIHTAQGIELVFGEALGR